MFIYFRYGTHTREDCWCGTFTCPHCGEAQHFHLKRLVFRFEIFFIPLFRYTKQRMMVCDKCNAYKELTKQEYKQYQDAFESHFERQSIPDAIVLRDFSAKAVHWGWRIAALFGILLLTALVGTSLIDMLVDTYRYGYPWLGCLIIFAIIAFPAHLAIRGFLRAQKKYQYFKRRFPKENTK